MADREESIHVKIHLELSEEDENALKTISGDVGKADTQEIKEQKEQDEVVDPVQPTRTGDTRLCLSRVDGRLPDAGEPAAAEVDRVEPRSASEGLGAHSTSPICAPGPTATTDPVTSPSAVV